MSGGEPPARRARGPARGARGDLRTTLPLALAAVLAAALLHGTAARAGDDPAEVARRLAEGELAPAEAAAAWRRAKVDPEAALRLVRDVAREAAPVTSHQATLRGPGGATTDAEVVFPRDGPWPDGRYGVLVLLHGIGGDARQGLPFAALHAPPHAICVLPSATLPPRSEDPEDLRRATAAGVDVMARFKHWWSYRASSWALAALHHALRRWPIDPDRALLVGYSMGGFGAWNVGLRFHDRFAAVAPLAGGLSREEMTPLLGRDPLSRLLLDNAGATPLFVVHGDEDDVVSAQSDRWTAEDLGPRRLPDFTYVEVKGGKHLLTSFLAAGDPTAARFDAWLAAKVRDPHPRRVVHRALDADHGAAFWTRLDALRGASGRVEAEVTGKNQVVVRTEGVARLTLFLDPALVDPRKRLQVAVDGRLAVRDVVRPSLEAVAESFARARDPALTFAHAVTLEVPPPGGGR